MPQRSTTLIIIVALATACADDSAPAAEGGTDGDSTTTSVNPTTDDAQPDDTAADTDGDTDGPGSTDDDTPSTDDAPTDTGPSGCTENNDCTNPSQPICDTDSGDCVDCSATPNPDAACNDVNPETPICDTDAGQCLACTADNIGACQGTTPVCDLDTNTCLPCTEHTDCPDSACKIAFPDADEPDPDWGSCFDVAVVDTVTTAQLIDELNALQADAEAVFRITNGGLAVGAVDLNDGQTVAILPDEPGLSPSWSYTSGGKEPDDEQLGVRNGARVWLHLLELQGNNSTTTTAVTVEGAALHVQRSKLVNNAGGALTLTSQALAHIENSWLSGNGNTAEAVDIEESDATFLYSTLGRSFNSGDPVLVCDIDSNVSLRNTLVISSTPATMPEVVCPGVATPNSLLISDGAPDDWMSGFESGDYTPTNPPAMWSTEAEWQTGDPAVDIDGTLRPNTNGAEDFVGADIPG